MEVWRHESDYVTEPSTRSRPDSSTAGQAEKTSVNKAVIELLEESAGGKAKKKAPVRYHDLDHLAGTWTKEEAAAFDKLIAEQRMIDPELWK